ncbi:cupin domain-containing protein [Cryobacterium sp. PH31-O1]|uniref:helix-turn-helix domain-containing protein n=1 Tax=Cryobacterium sp. PH31-O1 TaxID=3046306 RepID=UPI0024B8E260|nr:cupin domain-containing protein [Cryobacterium sp. PH31-O1]MDJ0339004.1 cupin domain-containing protein [Cryobacterium sp. PH31-O1]
MAPESDAPLKTRPIGDGSIDLGARMREARKSRGLSVRGLAALSGISASSISLIERNIVAPRIDTIVTVLRAMGLTSSQLFSDEMRIHAPLRKADRPLLAGDGNHLEYILTRRPFASFEVYNGHLQPGVANFPAKKTHGNSQEFVLIVKGTATMEVGAEEHVLEEGDSMEYLSSVPHRVRNSGSTPMEILWVISPPVQSNE